VQTASLLVILFEDVPGFRQIFLDGRTHPSNWDPTCMGHSTGKWDGDVLVVDTAGFNDRSWISDIWKSRPRSRIQELSFKPFHMNVTLDLAPREEIVEYVCENNHPEHLAGK
jgi:hypothetical protein